MAKRAAKATSEPASPRYDATTPVPPETLHVSSIALEKGAVLHRVHLDQYQADQFNPGVKGDARFSPIQGGDGEPIPTLYAGTTMACALMETVFHDVPHTAGFKTVDQAKLAGQVHSTVRVEQDLELIDLASVPLRKLGVTRRQLIDTEKDQYPATRQWAVALHEKCPQAQGLSWISRQDDSARAMVLFGDRIPDSALRSEGASRDLLQDLDAYEAVLDLADRIGVYLVPGKH
ncbi:RES family NAD+ phosphorylase [Burkholderia multivorans]|uniref:RES family NAD+ phosphorylase n=1 Tax=Burkholderia multivorans TaxID=87883 RepID=UPI003F7F9B05